MRLYLIVDLTTFRLVNKASFETYRVSFRPFQWIEICDDMSYWGIFPLIISSRLGVQSRRSHIFSRTFRATISPQFGVQSHLFTVVAFKAVVLIFSLTFKVVIHSLAYRVVIHNLAFKAIIHSLEFRVTIISSA